MRHARRASRQARERIGARGRVRRRDVREQLIDEVVKRNPSRCRSRSSSDKWTHSSKIFSAVSVESARARARCRAAREAPRGISASAERQVRAVLALDALVAQKGIVVSDDDVDIEFGELAAQAGGHGARVREIYREATNATSCVAGSLANEHSSRFSIPLRSRMWKRLRTTLLNR